MDIDAVQFKSHSNLFGVKSLHTCKIESSKGHYYGPLTFLWEPLLYHMKVCRSVRFALRILLFGSNASIAWNDLHMPLLAERLFSVLASILVKAPVRVKYSAVAMAPCVFFALQ